LGAEEIRIYQIYLTNERNLATGSILIAIAALRFLDKVTLKKNWVFDDLRTETYKLLGVDVTQIPGLEENALPLFSEVGRDMSSWPTAAHFISWLALCPDNDISGGKLLWRGGRKVKNRAGHLFRLAAFSLHHSLAPLGNYLRRMKAKLGPRSRHHGNRPQDRSDLLHHGQKPSRI
jgi:hypothetical protein